MEKKKEENKVENTKSNNKVKKVLKSAKNAVKKNKNTVDTTIQFNLLEVIIIILMTGVIVSLISGIIVYNSYDKLDNVSSNGSNDNKSDLDDFVENYNKILNNYIEKVDKDKLMDAAIEGMYNFLGDNYSVYISKDETTSLEEQLEGEYTGIGVEVTTLYNKDEMLTTITKVFKNTPAEKAGLKVGDILIALDDVSLLDKDASYVSNTIKYGKEDTHNLTVRRNNEEIKLSITRAHVFINSVTYDVIDSNIGYIKLDTFSQTAAAQVKEAIDSFDKNVKSLIIDVRDNTGGYLNSAEEVSELFIEKGKNIYQMKDRNNLTTVYKAKSGVYRKFDKIAVLINSNSASASEILALALKESAGATLVGTKSFGKGSVQETDTLDSGAMVKYTTAYWLSPNGNSINEKGIEPDVLEERPSNQINKAKEALK